MFHHPNKNHVVPLEPPSPFYLTKSQKRSFPAFQSSPALTATWTPPVSFAIPSLVISRKSWVNFHVKLRFHLQENILGASANSHFCQSVFIITTVCTHSAAAREQLAHQISGATLHHFIGWLAGEKKKKKKILPFLFLRDVIKARHKCFKANTGGGWGCYGYKVTPRRARATCQTIFFFNSPSGETEKTAGTCLR